MFKTGDRVKINFNYAPDFIGMVGTYYCPEDVFGAGSESDKSGVVFFIPAHKERAEYMRKSTDAFGFHRDAYLLRQQVVVAVEDIELAFPPSKHRRGKRHRMRGSLAREVFE